MKAAKHPLDALSADEITAATDAVRKTIGDKLPAIKALKFAYVTLEEPNKADVIRFLGIATSPDQIGTVQPDPQVSIPRRAEVSIIDALTGAVYIIAVSLDSFPAVVEKVTKLPDGVQPGITNEELIDAERIVREDSRVIKLCEDVGVKPEQIRADGWSIGYEQRFGKTARLQQCFMYASFQANDAYYSSPLDFNCVVDANEGVVVHIDFAPHRNKDGKLSSKDAVTAPPEAAEDAFAASGRERIPPPTEAFEYLPELRGDQTSNRPPLKPLHVVQPEGVSFKLDGNVLTWQNWSMHIGWSYREGLTLNTLQYNDNGRVRPILYRMSLAEFVVPYADVAWPHPRKHALDVGEYGLGMMSNSLSLGCDCLGVIQYLDGVIVNHDGSAQVIPSAICIHEEDAGLLWKHTDFREGGRAHAVRSRKLVLSMIITVANYEYAYYINILQDGTIQQELKLTGILQLYTLAQDESAGCWGTEVAPRVVAHHHQHLFSTRIDPMIDGLYNSVVETNVVPALEPTGSIANYAGNGFEAHKTIFETSDEAVRDYDAEKSRSWSIVNEASPHYASKQAGGFKIICKDMPRLLAKPDSLVGRRTPFALHNMWVVPDAADRLFPAGKFPTQTIDAPEDSLSKWAEKKEKVRNEDIGVFVTWGTTHLPRPEDFPVMPAEHLSLTLKPVSFFRINPAIDVPSVKDAASCHAKAQVVNGGSNGINGYASNGVNGSNGCH